ncbi:M3 family oligoendopeptidase [Clostridiaceae bacterium M8S5]|nr:M3 family oligoendopeptidase [Clostridiaceae bacterium M8S5]
MEMKWSLNELYSSFECTEFTNDFNKCRNLSSDFCNWSKSNLNDFTNPVNTIKKYLELSDQLNNCLEKLDEFSSLSSCVNTKDETAAKYCDKLQMIESDLTIPNVLFMKYLKRLDNLQEIINSDNLLKEHDFYLNELANKSKYLLSDNEEMLISKMKNTGSNAFSTLQDVVSSNLMVDIELDGKKQQLPLSVVRNLAYDKDSIVRQKAYLAELKSYKKIDESSAACINGIKGEVITLSDRRGYNSPLEKTLIDSRMDKETLDTMLSTIKDRLPVFHKYLKTKAKLLGHKNGLPFYDLFAPIGDKEITFSYPQARKYIVDNFRTFSDRLADFADNAFEKRWIDAEPREGKVGGAFSDEIRCIGESRILSNFNNNYSSMATLAHELGHGYHAYCLKDESFFNCEFTMPTAETASILCETIVREAALKTATADEALTILEMSISNTTQAIVDIYSRYLFETKLFEIRKDHALSVDELNNTMLEAQKEVYGDALNHEFLHPYTWACKVHYYYADTNFYNFPYAFGELFAKGLYAEYLKQGDKFIDLYDKLLVETGKNDIATITNMVNIDVHDKEFWKSSLDVIEKDINKFIELSEKML